MSSREALLTEVLVPNGVCARLDLFFSLSALFIQWKTNLTSFDLFGMLYVAHPRHVSLKESDAIM